MEFMNVTANKQLTLFLVESKEIQGTGHDTMCNEDACTIQGSSMSWKATTEYRPMACASGFSVLTSHSSQVETQLFVLNTKLEVQGTMKTTSDP